MPWLPSVEEFRGDFTKSFEHWIQESEAHLIANNSEQDKYQYILLVYSKNAAFSTFINVLQRNA